MIGERIASALVLVGVMASIGLVAIGAAWLLGLV